MPACCRAKHCHCVSLILTPFSLSSQTFSGSSGCQQTAMPGAVSLNIMLPSPFWLHTRHVRSSPVLANWSSSPGAKVTELTKSVWPFRTWRHQEKVTTLLRVTDKFNFIIEIDTTYCHLWETWINALEISRNNNIIHTANKRNGQWACKAAHYTTRQIPGRGLKYSLEMHSSKFKGDTFCLIFPYRKRLSVFSTKNTCTGGEGGGLDAVLGVFSSPNTWHEQVNHVLCLCFYFVHFCFICLNIYISSSLLVDWA